MSAVIDRTPAHTSVEPFPACMHQLTQAVDDHPDAPHRAVARVLTQWSDLPLPLNAEQRAGSESGYTRHVLYEDPAGRFCAMALVWRPGQITPAHGHRTWCAYLIHAGSLHEEVFGWNADTGVAHVVHERARLPGDVFSAAPGMATIHRLRPTGSEVAISLHVYGVPREAVTTGVNHVVTVA